LHVVPDKELARTDKAVTIEEPRGIIRGQGLQFDNKAKRVRILSHVSGTLLPQQPSPR
jgi:LPS export ABC transporter protein LptC